MCMEGRASQVEKQEEAEQDAWKRVRRQRIKMKSRWGRDRDGGKGRGRWRTTANIGERGRGRGCGKNEGEKQVIADTAKDAQKDRNLNTRGL